MYKKLFSHLTASHSMKFPVLRNLQHIDITVFVTHQPLSQRNLLPVSILLSVSYPTLYLLEHITQQMCKDLIWATHKQVRIFNPEVVSLLFLSTHRTEVAVQKFLIPLTYPFL